MDADADGCFDTVEQGVADSEEDGTAGTGVPTVYPNGLIVGLSYTKPSSSDWQSFGIKVCVGEICNDGIDNDGNGDVDCEDSACGCLNVCDPATSGLVDSDGDGVTDACDIDDDNDGIPDLDESVCQTTSDIVVRWTHNNPPRASGELVGSHNFETAEDMTFGSGLGAFFSASQIGMTGIDQANLKGAIAADDYLEYSFTTTASDIGYYLQRFQMTKHGGGFSSSADDYGYDLTVQISFDDFVSFTTIEDRMHIDTVLPATFAPVYFGEDYTAFPFISSTKYTLRVYFYNKTTDPTVPAQFDDFAVWSTACTASLDTDGDGIPNRLDLDSDNDGIYDLTEAHHQRPDANNDGILDGSLGSYGANGFYDLLETSVDSDVKNYWIRSSEQVWDGIYDAYEQDSDGDGCFDTEEAGVQDADDDGTAGTGLPPVNSYGLVTSISYAPPINNLWQDWQRGVCLVEDCANGIDDDGDGETDCLDSDCPKADAAPHVNH